MKKEWRLKNRKNAGTTAQQIAEKYGVTPVVARILANNGFTVETAEEFLNISKVSLHDPHLLHDIDIGADRILYHINKGNKICIANDYDVDGITSGYILFTGISKLFECFETKPNLYVDCPDRMKDGYGLNRRIIEDAKKNGVSLIVTCDNGIAAIEASELASEYGIEMVVTDHHEVFKQAVDDTDTIEVLPHAAAVIDPKQSKCRYPFKGICGAMVAFKLVQVLFENTDIPDYPFESDMVEMLALATVCDVMELKDENRYIVAEGLKRLKTTKNVGLQALIKANGIVPEKISVYTLGFVIGPCLNASGRLDTAKVALDHLLNTDLAKADEVAEKLVELNSVRKEMTLQATEKAADLVRIKFDDDKVLVVYIPNVHESIVGIVAGRLRELFNKPSIVLTDSAEPGILKGSGRSIEAYDMFAKIGEYIELLEKFGGHAMACGLSIKSENLYQFRKQVNQDSNLSDKDLVPVLMLDIKCPVDRCNEDVINSLELLQPYGNGNTKPLFGDSDIRIRNLQLLGQKKNVLKMVLEHDTGSVAGVMFGETEELDEKMELIQSHEKFMVAYEPTINEYMGRKSVQIVIKEIEATA